MVPPEIVDFLAGLFGSCGPGAVMELEGDASTRRYFRFRLPGPDAETRVVALYPEPFDAAASPFLEASSLLESVGVEVPEALAVDGARGLMLLEDVGSESLFEKARDDVEGALPWIERAVDCAALIQAGGTRRLEANPWAGRQRLDEDRFAWELGFFRRHFLTDFCAASGVEQLETECGRLAVEAAVEPDWLCHRDYQVRNLFVCGDRLVVIDFQDAQRGPLLYDIASLLLDSIELPPADVDRLLDRYRRRLAASDPAAARASAIDDASWERRFAAVASQRLVKALGTFGFQITQRHRESYRDLVAPTLRRARRYLTELEDLPGLLAALAAAERTL